jgi:hypothetical protein
LEDGTDNRYNLTVIGSSELLNDCKYEIEVPEKGFKAKFDSGSLASLISEIKAEAYQGSLRDRES